MSEWKEVTVLDVTSHLGDGLHGTPKYDDSGEYYFINGNNLSYGKILIKADTKRCNEVEYEKYKKNLNERTLLVSINGTLGNVAAYNKEKCILGKSACYFNVKEDVDKKFISYVLKDKTFQKYLDEFANGSTIKNVSLKVMREYPFLLPDIQEQEAITEILSSLDDKIDLLHRNNKTLEQLAETLFRKWFVEEVDEDWETVKLKDICTKITKGTTPTTMGHPFVENGVNFIKAESLNLYGGFIKDKFSYIDEETNLLLKRSQIQEGDILFTIAGTIGRTAIVTKAVLPANCNQAVAIIRVNNDIVSAIFMKHVMKSDYIQEVMESKIVHAVQPNLSLGEISETVIALPTKEKLNKFDDTVGDTQKKIENNNRQLEQLENVRDTLLPKLMSGTVKVNQLAYDAHH